MCCLIPEKAIYNWIRYKYSLEWNCLDVIYARLGYNIIDIK
jgi:hypothetical protein